MDPRNQQGRHNARPARPQQPQPVQAFEPQPQPYEQPYSGPPKTKRKWVLPAVVAAVLLLGGLTAWKFLGGTTQPRNDRYQAVFLDDDKVFFGKLKNTGGTYLRLEQAYSTRQTDLPADATEEQKRATANNISLVKVGDLVYGPENVIMLRADKVKFWQDLKTDSKVTKAIEDSN